MSKTLREEIECDWCGNTEQESIESGDSPWFTLKEEGDKHDFCSERCADKYAQWETKNKEGVR